MLGFFWDYIGIILGVYEGYIGVIFRLYWGSNRGIMEKTMETTIMGFIG